MIPQLVKKYKIDAIFCNKSYGTYGTKRDQVVQKKVSEYDCSFHSFKDFLLVEPHEVEQRKVFTPFYKLWQKKLQSISSPDRVRLGGGIFSQLQTSEQTEAKDFITRDKHPYFTMSF
jgi:deoxyribodipyrimidine photolyase